MSKLALTPYQQLTVPKGEKLTSFGLLSPNWLSMWSNFWQPQVNCIPKCYLQMSSQATFAFKFKHSIDRSPERGSWTPGWCALLESILVLVWQHSLVWERKQIYFLVQWPFSLELQELIYMYIRMAESLCYVPETITTLLISYTPI